MGRLRWEGPFVAMPRRCRRFVVMVPRMLGPCSDGAVLQVAEHRKRATYPELAQRGAQSFCVLGCEIGGRWNTSAMSLVRRLVALRSCRAPPAARGRPSSLDETTVEHALRGSAAATRH